MEALLVARWLLAFGVVAAIGAPIAALLFPRLPRRGAAFAVPSALLPFALAVFWIGQVTFGVHALVAALVVVLAASAAAYRGGAVPDWPSVLSAYGVFAAGFLLLVVFRAYNPGVTPAGGEQFLHFGLTNAIARAGSLPPEDFWFAGEPLRYYYGTQLQVTGFSMLTGTPLRYGFNLGIAAFYGVLFVTAYGLAGSLVAVSGRSYHLGGVLGAFFVAVGGSSTAAVRLAFGLLPTDVALSYGRAAFGAIRHMPYEEAVLTQSDPAHWYWFYTRYVVPGTLQEFPLYSFVKADLHGHALSNGYVLLAAALGFSYYLTPAAQRGRRLGILLGGFGTVAGVFGFMNTWSLPVAAGLAALAVAAARPHPATLFPDGVAARLAPPAGTAASSGRPAGGRVAAELWRYLLAAVVGALVAAVGVALASPFLVFGSVPTNEGIGVLPPRTALAPFLVVYGALLALFVGFLVARAWPAVRRRATGGRVAAAVAGLVATGAVLVGLDFAVLAVTGPVLLAAWWLVRTERAGFEAVLLVAGVGLLLSMELVYARVWPPTEVRWNTTLKVAVQAWTLAGAAAGSAAAVLVSDAVGELRGRAGPTVDAGGSAARSSVPHVLAAVLVLAVVAASAPFPVLAFSGEVLDDATEPDAEPTLDGLAVHDRHRGEQMRAIRWLDDRPGTPTIVEAPGRETYQWWNPASSLTGVPTVVGWDHQEGYRGTEAFERRAAAVDAVYAGPWADAAAVLREHDVDYVYVGPIEREVYGDDLRDFGERRGLTVAFETEAVTIYAVDRSALATNGIGSDGSAE